MPGVAPHAGGDSPFDAQEQRRLMYRGLRTRLLRTARLRPLVLIVDDVQWADRDSRTLFSEMPRPGSDDAPPVLVLATDRIDAAARRSARARRAERDARAVEKEKMSWSAPLALLLFGGLAAALGRNAEALARYEAAESAASQAGMKLHAAAARHQRGRVLGGADGEALTAEAARAMSDEGVVVPTRLAGVLAPLAT